MKQYATLVTLSLVLGMSTLSADALKNSLTHMLSEKESSSVMGLGSLDLYGDQPAKPKVKRTRSPKAVVATVNGQKILKREADRHLKMRTQGAVSNFDLLPKKQKQRLIKEMAMPLIMLANANKELSPQEREAALVRSWIERETRKTKISDEAIKEAYAQMKQQALEHNSTRTIPPLEAIAERMRAQMIEKKIIGEVMKDIKIEIKKDN